MITKLNDFINEYAKDKNYLKWKRTNITLRGINKDNIDNYTPNGGSALLGDGLYTAFLSNRKMANSYGTVYFVLNAIPKHPKIFNTLNDWEIYFHNILVFPYSKKLGKNYPDRRDFFAITDICKEMLKLGFDGIIIKGREMVNFTPPENVIYFQNEIQLEMYYNTVIK